jgi:ABC-type Fe3+ transport system substrate-binding protein
MTRLAALLLSASCLLGACSRDRGPVEIGIAYGTEKQTWLEWARQEFAKTPAGERVVVRLIPLGSVEGAQAILHGDPRIQVWSPASALYKELFVQDWQIKNGNPPILREAVLARTPLVFVFWEERYQAFAAKYGKVTFQTVGTALAESSGWQAIAGKPEWGLFKLGHTHPGRSNSGLTALALMAYSYHGKERGLELRDILDPPFQSWLRRFERGVSGLSDSTGSLMRELVLKGPSAFDAVLAYESVAVDSLKSAEGRWGRLRIVYPERNLWSDNPYYVLDVPASSPRQRQAAGEFLDFLLTARIQREALAHGFRPADPAAPIRFAESPFVLYQQFGLRLDPGPVCEPPRAEVLNNLLAGWQRAQGS